MRDLGNRNLHWPMFKNPVEINEWENFCISYSAKTRHIRMIKNGILEVEHVRPIEVSEFEDHLPSDWFGPIERENVCCMRYQFIIHIKFRIFKTPIFQKGIIAMKKKCYGVSAMGSFTDFNVWDKELTLEQMRQFTQCKVRMMGNLIPWDINDWTVTTDISSYEYRYETVDFRSLCSTKVIY